MYKVLEIRDNELEEKQMLLDYILSNYELYCPIIPHYMVNLGVKNNSGYDKPYYNNFVSELYGGDCYGECILFSDNEDEDITNFKEYIIKLMR